MKRIIPFLVWPLMLAGAGVLALDLAERTKEDALAESPEAALDPAVDPDTVVVTGDPLEAAKKLLEQGDGDGALMAANKALQNDPDNVEGLAVRSDAHLALQQFTEALGDAEKALNLAPDDTAVRIRRAKIYRHFGRYEEALEDFNQILAFEQDNSEAYFNRGAVYFHQGKHQEALDDFNKCIELGPAIGAAYFNRALTQAALENWGAARDDMNRFLLNAPDETWKERALDLLRQWTVHLSK